MELVKEAYSRHTTFCRDLHRNCVRVQYEDDVQQTIADLLSKATSFIANNEAQTRQLISRGECQECDPTERALAKDLRQALKTADAYINIITLAWDSYLDMYSARKMREGSGSTQWKEAQEARRVTTQGSAREESEVQSSVRRRLLNMLGFRRS